MTAELAGAYPMIVTPLAAGGELALHEIAPVVEHQLRAGCAGVATLGLAGEASELTFEERGAVARTVLEAAGPGRVVVGCSADDTGRACELAVAAAAHGAAAVMLAAPGHLQGHEALAGHFEAVARAIAPIPLIVQDAPAFLGITLGRSFIEPLMGRCDNVRHAKPEGTPVVELVSELTAMPGLRVLGGHGGLHLPDELAAGAIGTVPGPEAPAAHQGIVDHWMRGEHEAARAMHARLLPLLVAEFQGLGHYVLCVKELLVAQGLISTSRTRLAARPLSATGRELLLATARRTGLTGLGAGDPESTDPTG